MATEHRHTYAITNTEPAPEGISGLARLVTLGCTGCDESRKTITEKSDTEIQAELDAYNGSDDE